MALGASPGSVAASVLRQSALLITAGMLCGLPFAIVAASAADSLLWGVKPGSATIYVLAAGMLCFTGFVSAWLPARRAATIDPAEALWHT
jgi:ABC-type antimicrobial peptide transport system permease subunit